MRETTTDYMVADDDGDTVIVTFTRRHCMCGSPGCVDDEISIVLPGDPEDCPCRVQVPKLMTPYIEGLFAGNLKVVK